MADRMLQLKSWALDQLHQLCSENGDRLRFESLFGDAGFRCYYRISSTTKSWIAVDSPPESVDSAPFVEVCAAWFKSGVRVPEILANDLERGFMLLEDLGDQLLSEMISDDNADAMYQKAADQLVLMQQSRDFRKQRPLPAYDLKLLTRDVELFREWFVTRLLGHQLSDAENQMLDSFFELLKQNALEQPQVCVHRDFHSRNLIVIDDVMAVIDLQDSVIGPISYDLVSLLRDCYLEWPESDVERWRIKWGRVLLQQAGADSVTDEQFRVWFDLTGLHRHIKVLGIFSRLYLRDGKAGYLNDMPLVWHYCCSVLGQYPEFDQVNRWFNQTIYPLMQARDDLPFERQRA